jgi:uridine kinase
MYDKFIAPSELNADLVVPGLNNELQIEYMYNVILKKLKP